MKNINIDYYRVEYFISSLAAEIKKDTIINSDAIQDEKSMNFDVQELNLSNNYFTSVH
jgi:hypothetical protein